MSRFAIEATVEDYNRTERRRHNAIDVLEEATAEMAREYQVAAEGHSAAARQHFDKGNHNTAWMYQRNAGRYARLARRYLFALVGDGRGEE